jgi:hypothetical protein
MLTGILGALGIGAAAAGGSALTKSAYDRLQRIGEQAVVGTTVTDPATGQQVVVPGSSQLAQQAVEMSQFQPFTVTSTTGSQFGFTPPTQRSPEEIRTSQFIDQNNNGVDDRDESGVTMNLSMQEQFIQDMLQGQAESAMFTGPFGEAQRQQAAQQAFGLGGQFMSSAAQQPTDLNLLRGQFAGQVGGMLGQQPSPAIGQFGQQALGMGAAGLGGAGVPDISQTFAGIQAPGQRDVSGAYSGIQGPGLRDVSGAYAGIQDPGVRDVSQTYAGIQGPGLRDVSGAYAGIQDPRVRTAAGQLASRGLGLGMAGLDTQAPADVEALRRQYSGLAGQAAGNVLAPQAGREADVFERIRATQRPEEERQRLQLEERLAQQGRLGVRTSMFGGTPEQLALSKAQEEAQNSASLAAMQQAQAERQQALGTAQTLGGMASQQAGLSSQLQSQAQQRAAQLSQLGLSAEQLQAQLEQEGFGRQMQLGQAGMQAQQSQAQLEAQRMSQQLKLGQAGMQAQQAQSQLEQAGFGRQMQLGQAGMLSQQAQAQLEAQQLGQQLQLGQSGMQAQQAQAALEAQNMSQQMQLGQAGISAAQAQSGLQSQAQQRAAQLSQLGLSAQQIESQLQSEGLGRAVTSAQQAGQMAQLAGGLQAQQAGLGAQFAGLGSQLSMQDLAAQQAQQQLALGALTGSYMPQNQLLAAQQAAQLFPQLQQRGQLFGAGQFGETSMAC